MRQAQTARAEAVSRPQLIQSMIDAMRVPDLRGKILFTFAMLVIFRFVAHVPVPGVDTQNLLNAFREQALLGFLDVFSGGALASMSVAALGVYPYITASIVMQILTPVLPNLKALAQEGEYGRQRINQITHYLTVPIAFLQSYGTITLLQQSGVLPSVQLGLNLQTIAMLLSMVAGTMFLVWLGELITERGLGNGISLIIFGGIVARFPSVVGRGFLQGGDEGGLLLLGLFGVGIIFVIVLFTEAQRRVPVQYGRSVFRGGKMQRQSGSTFLPLRVNSAGMIPLIFASSIIILQRPAERRLRPPFRAVLRQQPRPAELHLLGSVVRPGGGVHVFLYHGGVPAAEPGGKPATERRVHSGNPSGPSDPGVPYPGHPPDNVGGCDIPGCRGYRAVLCHSGVGHTGVDA